MCRTSRTTEHRKKIMKRRCREMKYEHSALHQDDLVQDQIPMDRLHTRNKKVFTLPVTKDSYTTGHVYITA